SMNRVVARISTSAILEVAEHRPQVACEGLEGGVLVGLRATLLERMKLESPRRIGANGSQEADQGVGFGPSHEVGVTVEREAAGIAQSKLRLGRVDDRMRGSKRTIEPAFVRPQRVDPLTRTTVDATGAQPEFGRIGQARGLDRDH